MKRAHRPLTAGDHVELTDRARSLMNEGTYPPYGVVIRRASFRTQAYGREPGAVVEWIMGRGERSDGSQTVERVSNLRRVL